MADDINKKLEETKDNLEDVEYSANEAAKALRDLLSTQGADIVSNNTKKVKDTTTKTAKQLEKEVKKKADREAREAKKAQEKYKKTEAYGKEYLSGLTDSSLNGVAISLFKGINKENNEWINTYSKFNNSGIDKVLSKIDLDSVLNDIVAFHRFDKGLSNRSKADRENLFDSILNDPEVKKTALDLIKHKIKETIGAIHYPTIEELNPNGVEVTDEFGNISYEALPEYKPFKFNRPKVRERHVSKDATNLGNIIARYGINLTRIAGFDDEGYSLENDLAKEMKPYLDTIEKVVDKERNGKVIQSHNEFRKGIYSQFLDKMGRYVSPRDFLNEIQGLKQNSKIRNTLDDSDIDDSFGVLSDNINDTIDDIEKCYDSIDELFNVTRENVTNTSQVIDELDDSFGVLSDSIEANIEEIDDSFGVLSGDAITSKVESIEKEIDNIKDKHVNNRKISEEQSLNEREKVLREEQSIRYKLEKQAQAASEQALKKTENKVKEVCSTIVNTIKKTISNIIGIIRKLNTLLNKSINLLINGFRGAFNTIRRLLTLFGNFGNRIKTVSHNGNILKGTFTELKSKIDLLVGAFRSLFNNEFLQNGMKLLSSVQTLNMLIGKDLTAKTIDWANNLERSFGLSASGLIQNLQSVSSVLYGMGMSSENVYNAGRNLEALGMAMSSITGLDFDTVITKIDSGMKGMTQSIDDLGLSVRESQMDAFLQKLKAQGGEYANIGTKFANLTEDQRIYVRYAAIMDQFMSKEAFSAESYARSLNTLTGQMSILKQQVQQLKSTIGLLAIKLFAQIVKPLTYIVYLANLAVKKIAALFGIDLETTNAINELGGSGIDTSGVDGLTDSLNETADAAEDAKGGLSALDHITSLNTSSSKGTGADAFDYSKLANYNDNYADMLEDLGKMNNDYIEQCRQALIQMLKDMEKRVGDWFERLTGRVIDWDVVEDNLKRAWNNIKNIAKNIAKIFKNVFDILGGLFGSILDDLDFTTLFEKFTRLISFLTRIGSIITKRIQPHIQALYEKYLSPYIVKFGDWLEEHLDKWIKKTEEWLAGWESHKYDEGIKSFFEKTVPEKFEKLLGGISNVKKVLSELYNNIIKPLGGISNVKKVLSELYNNIIKPLGEIVAGVFRNLFDTNEDDVVNLEDGASALEKLRDKIKEIGDYLKENKDEIISLLTTAITFIGELAKAKVNVFVEIFKFMVEHEQTIKAVCDAVINLINFAIKHPVLSLTVAIGLSLAGQAIKSAVTAAIWKQILGVAGAEAAGTSIGTKIATGIKGALEGAGLGTLIGGTLIVTLVTAEAMAVKQGVKDLSKDVKAQSLGINTYELRRQAYVASEILRGVKKESGIVADDTRKQVTEDLLNDMKETYHLSKEQFDIVKENFEYYLNDFENAGWLEHQLHGFYGSSKAYTNEYKQAMDDLVNKYTNLQNGISNTENEVKSSTTTVKSEINNAANTITAETGTITNNVQSSVNDINGSLSSINMNTVVDQLRQLLVQFTSVMNNFMNGMNRVIGSVTSRFSSMSSVLVGRTRSIASAVSGLLMQFNNVTTRISSYNAPGFRNANIGRVGIKGFANGGIPQSGSLFLANENGNPELVGNFGGYSGVANQDMIIQAIKEAAVQNSNGTGTVINNNFNIGNMLGTDADFRKLVNKVTQVQRQQSYNIANGNFAMT